MRLSSRPAPCPAPRERQEAPGEGRRDPPSPGSTVLRRPSRAPGAGRRRGTAPRAAGQRPPPSAPSASPSAGAARREPGLCRRRWRRRRDGRRHGGRHGGREGGREEAAAGAALAAGAAALAVSVAARVPSELSSPPAARQQCQGLPAAPRPPPLSLLPRPPGRDGGAGTRDSHRGKSRSLRLSPESWFCVPRGSSGMGCGSGPRVICPRSGTGGSSGRWERGGSAARPGSSARG